MTVDLIKMLNKFKNIDDVETEDAYFKTRVPSVAPFGYLNIVYKPAPMERRKEVSRELDLHADLEQFYNRHNGARLFLGSLSVFGILPEHYSLERTDPFKLLPFDLLDINARLSRHLRRRNVLAVGSYRHNRSRVYFDRTTGRLTCIDGDDPEIVRGEWSDFNEWIETEVTRLSCIYDEKGILLAPPEVTLPGGDGLLPS